MKKINRFLVGILITISSNSHSALNEQQKIVNKNAQTCFGCHGEDGVSNLPFYPNLAGQKQKYIEKQLFAYRDGDRKNEIMSPMAKSLSDKDIYSLAEYFANPPIKN